MSLTVIATRALSSLVGSPTSKVARVVVTLTTLMIYYLRFFFKGALNDLCGSHVDNNRTLKRGGAVLTV